MRFLSIVFLVFFYILVGSPDLFCLDSTSEIHLGIETTRAMRVNLAISNFLNECPEKREKDLTWDILDILIPDLMMSDYFNIVSQPDKEEPMTLVKSISGINFMKWSLFGAENLITGKFCFDGEKLKIEGRLYDISLGQMIMGIAYRARETELRQMMHKLADEVIKRVSGTPGVSQTKIAFVSNISGNKEIYIMDYDGYNLTRLTDFGTITLLPEWSPDNNNISFLSYLGERPGIYSIDLKELKAERLFDSHRFASSPSYSPDGKRLVFASTYKGGNSEICLYDFETKEIKRLTFDSSIDSSPCFSPTGREIVFTSDRGGSPQIYVMDSDGLNVRRISFQSDYNDSPAWSPRGDLIAYAAKIDGKFCICTYELSNGIFTNLTPNAGNNENPNWSSDGLNIVFSSDRTGSKKLYIMDYKGKIKKAFLKLPGECETPSWSKIQY